MKPETPKMIIDWIKRISNENMDEDLKPINQEQEEVIKKLENVINFLRKYQVKNEECFVNIKDSVDNVLASLKFLPTEPSFDILPMEIKAHIFSYFCDSRALVASLVCQEWREIFKKYRMKEVKEGWFGGRNENYNNYYPTSILYLDNGFLIVVERSKMNIYDKEAKWVQTLFGKYNGLAKDPHGYFITSNQKEDGTTFITVIGQMNGHGIYGVKDSFPLDIARKQESRVRFLAVHGGNIYASDYALNSIYVVDMETRSVTTWDLNLSSPCASPCGLLLDDRGHVLVADSGNNRLIVLNKEGQLFREISLKEKNALCPSDFVKVRGKSSDGVEENHIVVTYTGGDGTDGRLVRFKCT